MATCGGYCQQMLTTQVLNTKLNSAGLTVGGYGGGRGIGGGLVPGAGGQGGLGVGVGRHARTPFPITTTLLETLYRLWTDR